MAELERQNPRISLNALAEYVVASPRRQRAILREQKYPQPIRTAYYREAERAIIRCIAGRTDVDGVRRIARILEGRAANTGYERSRLQNGVLAMTRFADVYSNFDLRNLDIRVANPRPAIVEIRQVVVSVRPELLLEGPVRGQDGNRYGMLKLYFGKDDPIDGGRADCTGAIVQRYAMEQLPADQPSDRRLCRVLDVFAGRLIEAPRATIRTFENIEAACEGIAALWNGVTRN